MKIAAGLAVLAVLVSGSAAHADSLGPGAVRALFPGRYLVKVMGTIDMHVNMKPNGTVIGSASGMKDTGSWSIEGGKLCIAWKTWNKGRKDCSALTREGSRVKGRGFWFHVT